MLTGRNFEQDHPADDELGKGRNKKQILEERRTIYFDHNLDMTLHHGISVFIRVNGAGQFWIILYNIKGSHKINLTLVGGYWGNSSIHWMTTDK